MAEASFLGLDFGTSGCRAQLINSDGETLARAELAYADQEPQSPELWQQALGQVLQQLLTQADPRDIKSIAVDGTSGTVLLADAEGDACSPVLMYSDTRAVAEAQRIAALAPAESGAHGPSSGLAKLLWLQEQGYMDKARYALCQTDWVNGLLSGHFDVSDENNALKLGYDPIQMAWPRWLEQLRLPPNLLPEVQQAGLPISTISPVLCDLFNFSADTLVCSGTTDSTAAVIATGAAEPGEGITSLGSSLVTKIISEQPVFNRQFGVYSQPYGDRWLVGGASNSGGAVLRQFFNDQQMREMSEKLKPEQPTGLDYYPLPATGERFPVNDPAMTSRISPRPENPVDFFQALLEGIAQVEKQAYTKLQELGAPGLSRVHSVGGGNANQAWMQIRQQRLGVPVLKSDAEAALGAAFLARHGWYTAQ